MKKILFALVVVLAYITATAGEVSALQITNGDQKKTYSLNELLERKDLEKITIKNDPSYPNKTREYQAVKVSSLFSGLNIEDSAVIQFETTDGFSAPIAKERLLNQSPDKSIAYIAIESPNAPWPRLAPNKPSTGPLYLIWKNPSLSDIRSEEWPFMLSGFTVIGTLESNYPAIYPARNISKTDPIYSGFRMFTKQCFACHTMNQQGQSQIGPDLNIPMNPTEYFQEDALKVFIRNPSNVRTWPGQRMHGFSESEISNKDLDNLIAYLKHMAATRSNATP